jgi:hypothetical protein
MFIQANNNMIDDRIGKYKTRHLTCAGLETQKPQISHRKQSPYPLRDPHFDSLGTHLEI